MTNDVNMYCQARFAAQYETFDVAPDAGRLERIER